jgi:HEAT repeats
VTRHGLLLAASLAAALTTPACRRGAKRATPADGAKPRLGGFAIENLSPPSDEKVDTARIEAELRQTLAASGLVTVGGADGGAAPTARARLAFAAECVEEGTKGEAHAQVRMRIDSRPADAPGALAFDVEGRAAEPYTVTPRKGRGHDEAAPEKRPSLTALVVRVARDLIEGVAARRRLQDGSPAALHAALVADGGELRDEAIRIIGEKQIREEVPALLELLKDDDENVRDAALGALIAMRERRAVRALADSRSLRDRREMRKIIEAISILGGQEADDYLSFIAATHDDDEIKAAAAAARARLQRREAEAGTR